jgi:hypothetical protein
MTATKAYLTSIASSPPPPYLTTDITNIIAKITAMETKSSDFSYHTDVLSGVNQNPIAETTERLSSLLSVGLNNVALKNSLNQLTNNPCGELLNVFGSLFLGQDLYEEILDYYQGFIGLINNGEALIAQILAQLDAFTNMIEGIIADDRNYFNNIVADLQRAALAQTLGSLYNHPCGRYILRETIGSETLVGELQSEYGNTPYL